MGDDYTGPVTVVTADDTIMELAGDIWNQSETITEMVKDTDPGDQVNIPLSEVPKEALDKVVEYMKKMAEFKTAGTSEEDRKQWVSEYKKSMEAQDQLPLLFQTMTAANFMNVKTLLDELCKFVAEMIAKRTPGEIEDLFNIKKGATYGEEQELIKTHKWIDPEGLIMKNYEEEAEKLRKSEPDKYGGKSIEEIINLSRGITKKMVDDMKRVEAAERGAAAAEARMGRSGEAGTGATRDGL